MLVRASGNSSLVFGPGETAMADDGDAQAQELGVQDLVQQTSDQAGLVHKLSQETSAVARAVRRREASARERAMVAKQRELAAHQRAIQLHEQAAALQERLGYLERAANARQHAQHARELLATAQAEQAEQARQHTRHARDAAATGHGAAERRRAGPD
jgi:hypothetical protein